MLYGSSQEKKRKEIIIQEYNNTVYSDKKIKAKYAPEYSVLKPDTSSDSDSLKSNGARCVSAKVQITQIGNKKIRIGDEILIDLRIEKDIIITKTNTIRVLNTDS
jgi:hypothetical protein